MAQPTPPTYAYSFDRATFRGRFASRSDALAAAREALTKWPAAAEAIYIGRRIDPTLHINGYADLVLNEMRHRAADVGDDPVDHEGLSADARRDLEHRLSQTLRDWLLRHELVRGGRIEEISEHALPLIRHVADASQREVSTLGVEG